jgi:excisionase family DNA binding protein
MNSIQGTDTRIKESHLARTAYVYIRQSSFAQVENHQESTRRQRQLLEWAQSCGWSREKIVLLDGDQGHTATLAGARGGFEQLLTAVAKGEAGVVAALEASRLARNSPDWAQLIYIARFTNTLIVDETGVYDPASSTDRMVLGIRGQVSEIEIDTSIHRMIEARWSKARRGEMIFIPPAGYDIDDLGQLVLTSDEQVANAIRMVFIKYDELGTVRQVFVWWTAEKLLFPVRRLALRSHPVVWMEPRYRMIYETLRNPIYAGAYVYGKNQRVRHVDPDRPMRVVVRRVRRKDWPVLIEDHHEQYITFAKYLQNQARMRDNRATTEAESAGAAREGSALLQGLVRCGTCGRSMNVHSSGGRRRGLLKSIQYVCKGPQRLGASCQVVYGQRVDDAVVAAFLQATQPAGLMAVVRAQEQATEASEQVERAWQLSIEKAQYEAQRAERQFHAVEPENRIVARELERRWNAQLAELEKIREQARTAHEQHVPLRDEEKARILTLGQDVKAIWDAETTTNRDRKRLLRCLLDEVQLRTGPERYLVKLVWKGSTTTELEVKRNARGFNNRATPEDTVDLVRKLAEELTDEQIARVLNRQGRRGTHGAPFSRASVSSLRRNNGIPRCPGTVATDPRHGPFTAQQAARELGVTPCTVYEWIRDGVLPAKQATVGAPWRVVLSDELRNRLCGGAAPKGWVRITEAAKRLGLSTSHVVYLVKTGKLRAVHTTVGKRRCWKVDVSSTKFAAQSDLFEQNRSRRKKEA